MTKRSPSSSQTILSSPGVAMNHDLDAGRRKKKQKLETRKSLPENRPSFHFNTLGFKGGRHVTIKEIRELILYLLVNGNGNNEPNWLTTRNKQNIEHVVVFLLPGVTPADVTASMPNPGSPNMPVALGNNVTAVPLPIFSRLFSHYCPTKAAGDRYRLHSCLQTFVTTPMHPREKEKRQKQRQADFEKSQKSASAFLLDAEAMEGSLYPMPKYSREIGFHSGNLPQASGDLADWRVERDDGGIQTPQTQLSPDVKIFGVDCEMVQSVDGAELARVSVVGESGNVALDMLAKPSKPILDYATRFSGMTKERLENVTTTLEDVQRKLAALVDYNTILVGHSLDCDLRALKIAHPWVIDTALLYQHPRGPPLKPSLKWLAQKWLDREIQVPNQVTTSSSGESVLIGHDSTEDAMAAMDLLSSKLKYGPTYGEFVTDQEIIFERFARGSNPVSTLVVDHGNPGNWHAAKATHSIACETDEEVLDGLLENVSKYRFAFARFQDLSHSLGWSQSAKARKNAQDAVEVAEDTDGSPQREAEASSLNTKDAYATLDRQIKQLYDNLPPRTALIIFTGHDDPRPMAELLAKKSNFDRLYKLGTQADIAPQLRYTEADDRLLLDLVERTRLGMSFYAIR